MAAPDTLIYLYMLYTSHIYLIGTVDMHRSAASLLSGQSTIRPATFGRIPPGAHEDMARSLKNIMKNHNQ